MHASHICDLHNSQKGRPMIRCCGRISCFRILHLLSPKAGNCNEKQLGLATHFDSFPTIPEQRPDVCFVTNLRLSHHTKLRLLHSLSVMSALGQQRTLDSTTTYRCGELSRRESTVVASCKVSCVCLCCANRMAPIDRPPKNTATNAKPHAVPRHGELGLTPHSCLSKSSQSR